jgi:hypothetical protein
VLRLLCRRLPRRLRQPLAQKLRTIDVFVNFDRDVRLHWCSLPELGLRRLRRSPRTRSKLGTEAYYERGLKRIKFLVLTP